MSSDSDEFYRGKGTYHLPRHQPAAEEPVEKEADLWARLLQGLKPPPGMEVFEGDCTVARNANRIFYLGEKMHDHQQCCTGRLNR